MKESEPAFLGALKVNPRCEYHRAYHNQNQDRKHYKQGALMLRRSTFDRLVIVDDSHSTSSHLNLLFGFHRIPIIFFLNSGFLPNSSSKFLVPPLSAGTTR